MKKIIYVTLVFFLACQTQNGVEPDSHLVKEDKKAIEAVMDMQETAWNAGDLDAFMGGYWNSEMMIFIGNSGIRKGWAATLERYHTTYPDKQAMGNLSFEIIELNRLSDDYYHMIGSYTLQRENDAQSGLFTLIWKKIEGKWLIIADHTC